MASLGLLLVFAGISAFLSKGLFVWPNPEKHRDLPFVLVCMGAALFLLPALFPTETLFSSTSVSQVSFHGVFVFSAFLFFLLGLPLPITKSILYAGSSSSTTSWLSATKSGVRMWVVTVTATQILARSLQWIFPLILPSRLFQEQVITEEVREHLSQDPKFLYICCIAVLIPIAEEIFFRGILQNFFKNTLSRHKAIVASSLIFAVTHTEASLGSLIFVPTLFVFSLCAGSIYEKTRHIAAPITLHILFNKCQLILLSL